MRNNKILAISLILATFIIAVFTPTPAALVHQVNAAPLGAIVTIVGQHAMAAITHTPLNLTERTYAKSAVTLISSGTLWRGYSPFH